jgi:hypothetical protein
MPFEKGQSGNPSGRPKGSKSPHAMQWERLSSAIVGIHADRFNQELQGLEGKDFIDAYTKILKWFKPTLTSIEATGANGEALNFTINLKPTDGSRDQQGVLPDTDRPE